MANENFEQKVEVIQKKHEVKFNNNNEFCCFGCIPIRVGVSYIIFIGILISVASITLGALTTNYTLITAYALVLFFNILLLAGHVNKHPTLYILYVIGNWSFAFISFFLFGVAWILYWVDNNRWIKHEDSQVWRWSGLPFGIDNRWLIFTFSLLYMFNYLIQHFFVFIVKRCYQNLIQDLELE